MTADTTLLVCRKIQKEKLIKNNIKKRTRQTQVILYKNKTEFPQTKTIFEVRQTSMTT